VEEQQRIMIMILYNNQADKTTNCIYYITINIQSFLCLVRGLLLQSFS